MGEDGCCGKLKAVCEVKVCKENNFRKCLPIRKRIIYLNKTKYLNNPKHLVLSSVHPSPLSAYGGFFGSKPFSKTNKFLLDNNLTPIKWVK